MTGQTDSERKGQRNFAVSASEETISKGMALLERCAYKNEKKGDTLNRLFDMMNAHLEGMVMVNEGVDVAALDAALSNIRSQFVTASQNRNQIVAKKEAAIAQLRNEKNQLEADCKAKLSDVEALRKEMREDIDTANQAVKQAQNEAASASDRADALSKLTEEKDRTIQALSGKLTEAEAKGKEYDRLVEEQAAIKDQVRELIQELNDLKKDHATEIRELNAENEHRVSDARKDEALKYQQAAAAREKELMVESREQMREYDRENARLQMQVEELRQRVQILQQEGNQEQRPLDESEQADSAD